MLEGLSKKIGLTTTEIKTVVFVVSIFVIGFGYKHFFHNVDKTGYKIFDYSLQDSLFYQTEEDTSINFSLKSDEKKVDYKQEVLDFNTRSFNNVQKKNIPAEKSINLNLADVKDFEQLPGIGEKTAQNIVDYRNSIKKFTDVNQLKNVKGIGESKFQKIKKYIFIE
jgi:competence ComEA-like helix-hairpin-helix protein